MSVASDDIRALRPSEAGRLLPSRKAIVIRLCAAVLASRKCGAEFGSRSYCSASMRELKEPLGSVRAPIASSHGAPQEPAIISVYPSMSSRHQQHRMDEVLVRSTRR